jgi:hypothetical protein
MSEKRQPRRVQQVDKIRSIFWFHWIGEQIGTSQANEVRKVLEPNKTQLSASGEPDKNDKFSHYKLGIRMPNATLIEHANRLVPGSMGIINLTLWSVLRHQGPVADVAMQWIVRLSPKVQNLMIKQDHRVRDQVSDIYLRELIKVGKWDSLAGLTILLMINLDTGDQDAVWRCAHAIFGLLILLSTELIAYGIAGDLYALYAEKFFKQAKNGAYQRAWGTLQFERTAIGALIWAERERALATGRKRSIEYYIMAAVSGTLENGSKNIVPMMIPDLDVGPPTEQGALMQKIYRNAVNKAGSAYK